MTESRNTTIDICKGIGILLVVLGHLPNIFGSVIYSFHMGLFFILSGWCFKTSYLDNKFTFVKRRFIQIFLPFLLFKGVSYGIKCSGIWPGYSAIEDEYSLMGTMWFLEVLFVASILSLFLLFILREVTACYRIVAPFITLAFTYIVTLLFSIEHEVILFNTTFYLLGVFFRQYEDTILVHKSLDYKRIMIVSGGAFLLLITAQVLNTSICYCDVTTYLPYMIVSVLGSWLTLQFSMTLERKQLFVESLVIIGRKTMPILLFQWPAFGVITVMLKYNVIHVGNETLITIMKFLAGVSIPLTLDYIYQETKKMLLNKVS